MEARDYVRDTIRKARRTSAHRLPTIAEMARSSGIPHHQIHRAVAALRGPEGLRVRRGRGIELVERLPPPKRKTARARQTAGQRVFVALVQRLRRGGFSDGDPIPSIKELSHQYGVHRDTMNKVMRRLAGRGWVTRRARHYFAVRTSPEPPFANHIVFVGRGLHEGIGQAVFPGAARLMSTLDQECARRGIRLRFAGYDHRLVFPEPGTENIIRSALGTVIWPYSLPDDHALPALVSQCKRLQDRVVVLDQTGRLPHPGQVVRGMKGVRCYSLSQNEYDGYDVAVHVLQRGHQRAAYVTYEEHAPWSARRYRGVRSAFAAYGEPRGIRLLRPARKPLTFRSPQASAFVKAYEQFLEAQGLHTRGPRSQPAKPYQFMAEGASREFFVRSAMLQQLAPLFERALADQSSRVWICSSDDIAFAAHRFLTGRGVAVPGEVSLIGFDDSRLAMHYRFSSYNFNMHGLSAELVEWVLHGSPRGEDGLVRRVEGFVNDRGTVRTLLPVSR